MLQRKSQPCTPWGLVTDGKDSLESRLLLSYNAQVAVLGIWHLNVT